MSDIENFVFDSFDLSDPNLVGWDGTGGGPPDIAQGEHLFECTAIKVVPTKAGDGKNFECDWKVVDGDAAGKTMKTWSLFASDKGLKEGSRKRIKHVFADALRVPINEHGGFETKDVLGRRMYATISHEESTKYDPTTQATKVFVNASMSCERPYEDDQQTQQQAAPPPPKAPTAPPSRPPAAPPVARPPARPPAQPPVRAR